MIELNKIKKSFGEGLSKVDVLKNISLKVEDGEFVAIMGKSGCGKTTLLNILGTLQSVDSGEYLLSGEDITNISEKARCALRRRKIAIIYQNYNIMEDLTVLDNAVLPFVFDKRSYDKEYLDKLAESLELDKLMSKRAGVLSGGEKQRVAIMRALLQKPEVILADEPTGNLDSVNSDKVIETLKKGNLEYKQTIIMVTHDKEIAEQADRIVYMKDGEIRRG